MARKARCFEEGGFTYSGSEEDAMATAKRRMAERDAEYAAANPPKPAAPKAAASKPRFRAAPYPEDSPAKNPNVRAMRVSDEDIARGKAMTNSASGMSRAAASDGPDLSVPRARRVQGLKKGGSVKSGASGRADGCAQRGKTRGRMV